ncbi:hypothetical protein INT47_005304 [Mucor saturninus]|uniref:Alpha-1,4-N-acetylglucosaminyltransferase n=1 Tax=Mucor saturninus TaxID=64648 RepID=A0A8H7V0W0_9FUNG|nr:hypothetical protein INT47_005304 [Mucor saturninus]
MLLWSTNSNNGNETTIRPNAKQVTVKVLKWSAMAIMLGIITFFTLFGIDFNPHVSLRESFSPPRAEPGPLVSSCFQDYTPEKSENQHFGIIPSVPVVEGDVCYNYASLLKPVKNIATIYHTFWSSKTRFTEKELAILRSFIATQPSDSYLYLWVALYDEKKLEKWIHDDRIQVKVISNDLIEGTPFTENSWLSQHQEQSNLLRLATLYKFGGLWFDFNVLFVRDMSPLLSQEWISQSNCLDNTISKGSFLHFFKSSPYVCEMIAEANQQLKSHTQLRSLGSDLYSLIFSRLLKHKIQTWAMLPWCYTDPSQCLKSNSLPNAFDNSDFDKSKLSKVFAYTWHRSWNSSPGSIFKYLVKQHKQNISW